MQVAISVDALAPGLSGIGRYCLELVEGLPTDPRVSRLSCFRGDTWLSDPHVLLAGATPPLRRGWRSRAERWLRVGRFPETVVHAPNYFLPPWAERGVATVHDLSVFKYPETHPAERVRAFEANFRSTIDRAGIILTDCEWVREEVIAFAGIAAERVVAVHLGIADAFRPRPAADLREPLWRYGLVPGAYGLSVSTLEPRKRIETLLAAWRNLPATLRQRCPLVLAGGEGWRNEGLLARIEAAQSEGWLVRLGYVPEEDLPALYAGAAVFAYPSCYEGFGFPPLEAMASGVPTVVAAGTCLEEVAGAAAALVEPDDVDSFSAAIGRLLTDEPERISRRDAGIALAAQYSWSQCVEKTVAAYQLLGD